MPEFFRASYKRHSNEIPSAGTYNYLDIGEYDRAGQRFGTRRQIHLLGKYESLIAAGDIPQRGTEHTNRGCDFWDTALRATRPCAAWSSHCPSVAICEFSKLLAIPDPLKARRIRTLRYDIQHRRCQVIRFDNEPEGLVENINDQQKNASTNVESKQ